MYFYCLFYVPLPPPARPFLFYFNFCFRVLMFLRSQMFFKVLILFWYFVRFLLFRFLMCWRFFEDFQFLGFWVFGVFGGVGIHIAHCQDPFREAGSGIPFHYMILYDTQLTYTVIYSAVLFCIILCNGGDGIPIPYTRLCCTIMYGWSIIFCNGEMAPNPLQEGGCGIPSHYNMILYYTQLTDTILSYPILCCCILYYSML